MRFGFAWSLIWVSGATANEMYGDEMKVGQNIIKTNCRRTKSNGTKIRGTHNSLFRFLPLFLRIISFQHHRSLTKDMQSSGVIHATIRSPTKIIHPTSNESVNPSSPRTLDAFTKTPNKSEKPIAESLNNRVSFFNATKIDRHQCSLAQVRQKMRNIFIIEDVGNVKFSFYEQFLI